MVALDTNIIIRFLVRDDEKQAKLVYSRLKETEDRSEVLFVPLVVLLEVIWVLESAYEMDRNQIILAIEDLMQMPIIKFEADSMLEDFLSLARGTNIELDDLLIGCSAKSCHCSSIITFDKKAGRFPFFEILK